MHDEGMQHFPDANFWWYHNLLSMLTAKETRVEMECCGILCHWILPENGLNAGTKYAHCPVGNCPEFMPWDCSLLKYFLDSLMQHVQLTSHLPKDHPQQFKITLQLKLSRLYH